MGVVGESSLLGQVGDEIHKGRRVPRRDYVDDSIVGYEVRGGLPPWHGAEAAEVEIKENRREISPDRRHLCESRCAEERFIIHGESAS